MMDSLNCRRRLQGQNLIIKQALFLPDTMTPGEVLLIEFPFQLNCGVSDANHLIAAHLSVSRLWYVYESRCCPAGCRTWLRYQVESVDWAEAPEAVASKAPSFWREKRKKGQSERWRWRWMQYWVPSDPVGSRGSEAGRPAVVFSRSQHFTGETFLKVKVYAPS